MCLRPRDKLGYYVPSVALLPTICPATLVLVLKPTVVSTKAFLKEPEVPTGTHTT